MKHNPARRIWLLIAALLFVAGVALTALAASEGGDISGDGKVTVFDAQLLAEAQSGHRTLSTQQQSAAEGWTAEKILDVVLGRQTDEENDLQELADAYERFTNMSGEEQAVFIQSFDSVPAFFEWLNTAKEAYKTLNPDIEVGEDGSVDLGGSN